MFTMRNICLFVIGACLLAAWGKTFAEECSFLPTSGNWDSAGNWSCGDIPGSDDTAIIASGKTCTVASGGSDQACISFDVGGTLVIETGRTLTISANSVVDGIVNMQGSLSLSSSLTISGDGTIILQQKTGTGAYTSQITGAGTLTLSDDGGGDELTVVGTGEIDNVLVNNAVVRARTHAGGSDFDGQLELNGDMSGSGRFEADDGEALEVIGEATGAATWTRLDGDRDNRIVIQAACCVTGDVLIIAGTLDVEADFCTTGDLELGDTDNDDDGASVEVAAGRTAIFGVAITSCSCP